MQPRTDNSGAPVRGLGLVSGGLDSLLACLILRRQGITVEAVTFTSPFLKPDSAQKGCQNIGVPLRIYDFTDQHIEIVKNPRFGRGANMNPCLDCHTLMISLAHRIRREEGFHFVFTGEVVGQRPMSQTRHALGLVGTKSEDPDYLLRPLSALRLDPTAPERAGLVDRELLCDFSGRGRKSQMALAEELGLTEYPAPAGGCPLTDVGFSRRLKRLFEVNPDSSPREMELLHHGRHFDLGRGYKLVLGRSQADNDQIQGLARSEDIQLFSADLAGPLGLIALENRSRPSRDQLDLAGRILTAYTKAAGPTGRVEFEAPTGREIIEVQVVDKAEFKEIMIV